MAERKSTGHCIAEANVGIKTAYQNGVLVIYGGASLPDDLDDAITATPLCVVTLNGGDFTAGTATNGLNFDTATTNTIYKSSSETWSGTILPAAGSSGTTATFWVMYANAYNTSASTTAVRMAGSVSTLSTAELPMANPVLVAGAPFIITNFAYTIPKS